MADPFNTPVGQSVLQGAQVFNQSVQVFLQDQRARQQLELRRKEIDDLAKIREQRLTQEKEVLSLKEEKLAVERDLTMAQTKLIEAQTTLLPQKIAAGTTRAGAQVVSAEASQQRAQTGALKAQADIVLSAKKVELRGREQQFSELQQRAIDRPLPKDLKPLEGLSIEELEKQSLRITSELNRTIGEETFFPEEQQNRVSALRNELNKVNRALKLRSSAMNELLPAMKFDQQTMNAVQGVITKLNESYPIVGGEEVPAVPAPRTTFNLQVPEQEALDVRARSLTRELDSNKLIAGQVSEKTVEAVADELFALTSFPEGYRTALIALEKSADDAVLEKIENLIRARVKLGPLPGGPATR
jgi:hypothetical protein